MYEKKRKQTQDWNFCIALVFGAIIVELLTGCSLTVHQDIQDPKLQTKTYNLDILGLKPFVSKRLTESAPQAK